eukprot:gene9984-biopygen4749
MGVGQVRRGERAQGERGICGHQYSGGWRHSPGSSAPGLWLHPFSIAICPVVRRHFALKVQQTMIPVEENCTACTARGNTAPATSTLACTVSWLGSVMPAHVSTPPRPAGPGAGAGARRRGVVLRTKGGGRGGGLDTTRPCEQERHRIGDSCCAGEHVKICGAEGTKPDECMRKGSKTCCAQPAQVPKGVIIALPSPAKSASWCRRHNKKANHEYRKRWKCRARCRGCSFFPALTREPPQEWPTCSAGEYVQLSDLGVGRKSTGSRGCPFCPSLSAPRHLGTGGTDSRGAGSSRGGGGGMPWRVDALLGETALPASCPRLAPVRFFGSYRAARARSTSSPRPLPFLPVRIIRLAEAWGSMPLSAQYSWSGLSPTQTTDIIFFCATGNRDLVALEGIAVSAGPPAPGLGWGVGKRGASPGENPGKWGNAAPQAPLRAKNNEKDGGKQRRRRRPPPQAVVSSDWTLPSDQCGQSIIPFLSTHSTATLHCC